MNPNRRYDAIYVPGETTLIALIDPDTDRTLYSGTMADQLLRDNPRAIRLDSDLAMAEVYGAALRKYRTAPQEITRDLWDENLNVLPPVKYHRQGDQASFMMAEYLMFDLTVIYVRIGDRYWSFTDRDSLTHDQIVWAVEFTLL